MSNFKIRPIDIRNPDFEAYVNARAQEIKAQGQVRPKGEPSEHVKRVMSMSDAELAQYRNREIDYSKAQVSTADTMPTGNWSPDNLLAIDRIRKRGHANSKGKEVALESLSVSPERIRAATEAFSYSPPADLTKGELEKVKELRALETIDQKIEKKKSLLEKAKEFFLPKTKESKRTVFKRDKHGDLIYDEEQND